MKNLYFLIILLSVLSREVFAKNVATTGAITYFGLSAKIGRYETLNFNHSDVFNFSTKNLKEEKFKAGVEETSFQVNYSYQLRPSISLAGGYIYQREIFEEENENRIFEQVTFSKNFRRFSTTHRFRFEQRFIEYAEKDNSELGTRIRYQMGANFPLRGLVVDPGEFYINAYNEFYFSTSGQRYSFFSEDWLYGAIGYQTRSLGSFELGPTIQWITFNNEKYSRTHYAVQFGWIVRL
jgi:hypothetical protein